MAYILTPSFAPAYQAPQCNPFGFCAPVSRPAYAYRTVARPQPRRPSYSAYPHLYNQVNELLSGIDRETQRQAHLEAQLEAQREAQREAHRQRQQRKRALRAKFAVAQNEQGWQVDAEITGFTQENINIEITDENTLKVAGNTEWRSESQTLPAVEAGSTPEVAAEQPVAQTTDSRTDNVTVGEPETETEPARSGTPDSDTHSHRSYQPTVEDDYEDLGAETSSLISTPSVSTPVEPKGKEKANEEFNTTETVVTRQPQLEAPVPQPKATVQQQQQEEDSRPRGSFERTFRFPERIDASSVRASFKDGILHIAVPRVQAQPVRRIAIL